MKKIVSLLLVCTLLAALCACGKKPEAKAVDLNALGEELAGSAVFSNTMVKMNAELAVRLYGLDENTASKSVLYISDGGATAEEIFLAEAADADGAAALKTACEERIAGQKDSFKNYVPEEIVKLDDAVLVTEGNCVILVVSCDSAAARGIVDGYIGG